MDDLLPLTTLPLDDERRFLYTYCGQQVLKGSGKKTLLRPLYVYDAMRMRPTLVLGEAWQYFQNLAFKDLCAQRTVIILDADPQLQILDELSYWCSHQLQRPFFTILPQQDDLSHTWNPFFSAKLKNNVLSETLFAAYSHYSGKKLSEDDLDFHKEVLGTILRIFQEEDMICNSKDIVQLLTQEKVFQDLKNLLQKEDAQEYYEDLAHLKEFEDDFDNRIKPLIAFLENFNSWIFSTYHPSARIGKLIHSNSILYVGLPLFGDERERAFFSAVGNLLLHQIKAQEDELEANDRENRRAISLIVRCAENFLDKNLLDWMTALKAGNILLTYHIHDWTRFQSEQASFVESIRANTSNIVYYNPSNSSTSSWFADMWRQKRLEDGFGKENPAAWSTRVNNLAKGLYLFETPIASQRPMLMAGPYMPSPPARADLKYRRQHYNLTERPAYRTMHSEIAPPMATESV
ncbi:MAG: hypothetical protein ACOY3I_06290 [Verrucomicrobiota bacterium]